MTAPVGERALSLDPRLRARRREIQRHQGRRRLRRLQAILGLAALGAGAWVLALSPVADVDRVQVQGAMRSDAEIVEEATGIHRGEAMATLDLGAAGAAVEALPWVATATLTRYWPGRVVVTVAERRAVAVVAAGGQRGVVVDSSGRQLAVVEDGAFPELALITGLAAQPDPGASLGGEADAALKLASLLPEALPVLPTELALEDGELEVRMRQGSGRETLVRFGEADRLADKVAALAALIDAGVLAEVPPPLVVDLRAPDAPALTRTKG